MMISPFVCGYENGYIFTTFFIFKSWDKEARIIASDSHSHIVSRTSNYAFFGNMYRFFYSDDGVNGNRRYRGIW